MRDYDERIQKLKKRWHETVIQNLISEAEELRTRADGFLFDMTVERPPIWDLHKRTFYLEERLIKIRRLLLETELFQDKEIFFEGFVKEAEEKQKVKTKERRANALRTSARKTKTQRPAQPEIAGRRKRPAGARKRRGAN